MKMTIQVRSGLRAIAVAVVVACALTSVLLAQAGGQAATILKPADVKNIMPASVFFRGQSATVQLRNTYGLRLPDGTLVLAGLVDSSGYSSGIKTKYQGYLLTESALTIDGKTLPAGAYGFGFLANNQFVVMDIGAHDVLRASSQTDPAIKRPRPLMILPGSHLTSQPGSFRLYEGRSFVVLQLK